MSDLEQQRVAMVIMAHPDDAEFGCAGTVAGWAREGWDVYYVVITDASAGGPDEATDVGSAARSAITATRKAEQRAAAAVLGLRDVIFLDKPDGLLEPTIELRRDLVRLMRRYRPTRVVCQSPERSWRPTMAIGRYHPDHLAAGVATLAAIYPACQNPWDFPELLDEGLPPHKVREIYIMGAPEQNYASDAEHGKQDGGYVSDHWLARPTQRKSSSCPEEGTVAECAAPRRPTSEFRR